MSEVKDKVESLIADNKVTVFTKSWCRYCKATKALLDSLGVHEEGKTISEADKKHTDLEDAGIQYHNVELDLIPDGAAIQAYLAERDNQTTVPNVFINQKHIGGNDDIQALNKGGKLTALLNA